MIEAQLNIRSTKAKTLASKLARQQRRTVSQIVEMALEQYAQTSPTTEVSSAENGKEESFWRRIARMSRDSDGPDIDLEAIINEHRVPHKPIEL
jgi:hypothetical protein